MTREIYLVVDHVLASRGLPCVSMITSDPRKAAHVRKQLERGYRDANLDVSPLATISTAEINE